MFIKAHEFDERIELKESNGRPLRGMGYRCRQVHQYILKMAEQGIVPSYAMVADACEISTIGKVNEIVRRLERRGLLERTPQYQRASRYARTIRLRREA